MLAKNRLEQELALPCNHFACPWGQPEEDYVPDRDPLLARQAGYRSFFTTLSARATPGVSAFALPRIVLEPGWGCYQLRYLFSR